MLPTVIMWTTLPVVTDRFWPLSASQAIKPAGQVKRNRWSAQTQLTDQLRAITQAGRALVSPAL